MCKRKYIIFIYFKKSNVCLNWYISSTNNGKIVFRKGEHSGLFRDIKFYPSKDTITITDDFILSIIKVYENYFVFRMLDGKFQ